MSELKKDWDITELTTKLAKVIEVHFKKILILFVVGILAASLLTYKRSVDRANEKKAFNELYTVTKDYDKKKADFTAAKEELTKKQDPKKTNEKNKADETKKFVAATGDMEKDYGPEVKGLEAFIASHLGKNASGEAALILSEIYSEYNLTEKGVEVLAKTLAQWDSKNILYYVMQMRSGDLWASLNQCDKAVGFWKVVAEGKSFITDQAQLKLGVCLQAIGQYEEAKMWFEKISTQTPNSTEGFNAKRYLRFIEFKSKNELLNEADSKAQKKEAKKDSPS